MHVDQIELIRLSWRHLLPILLEPAKSPVNGETSYICPFCSHGAHGDGLTFDPHTPGRLHCFGPCGWSGDVIDLYRELKKCNFNDALTELSQLLGSKCSVENNQPSQSFQEDSVRQFLVQAHQDFPDSPAETYLESRGISNITAIGSGVGFCETWRHPKVPSSIQTTPRLIIPTSAESYLARDIRPSNTLADYEKKYCKQKVGSAHFFCFEKIENSTEPIFIVEGEIDALSIMEIGHVAVALGSVSCCNQFLKQVAQGSKPKQPFIISLDNDAPGAKATRTLLDGLAGQGVIAIDGSRVSGIYKDVNESLVAERSEFEKRVYELERLARSYQNRQDNQNELDKSNRLSALVMVSTKAYLENDYENDIKQFSQFSKRRTGFSNLDAVTALYPGLYALGGISSLGKTTFIHQMADQLAAAGEHVLYFPIEQSPMELISKGVSRIMYRNDPASAIPSIRLRSGYTDNAVRNALSVYSNEVKNLYIAKCDFNTTVMEIRESVRCYAEKNAVSPIVVVDYLQALQSPDLRMAPREAIDLSLRVLKDLQMELAATIIIISSINRSNYLVPIGFESFKESGGIEYTCDVVWGIDLFCMNDPLFDTQGQIKKKREIIDRAKTATPREVRLMCLKNRYGISSYSVGFNYFPMYDIFVPMLSEYKYDSSGSNDVDVVLISEQERASIINKFLE